MRIKQMESVLGLNLLNLETGISFSGPAKGHPVGGTEGLRAQYIQHQGRGYVRVFDIYNEGNEVFVPEDVSERKAFVLRQLQSQGKALQSEVNFPDSGDFSVFSLFSEHNHTFSRYLFVKKEEVDYPKSPIYERRARVSEYEEDKRSLDDIEAEIDTIPPKRLTALMKFEDKGVLYFPYAVDETGDGTYDRYVYVPADLKGVPLPDATIWKRKSECQPYKEADILQYLPDLVLSRLNKGRFEK
jgi:hypothetical protein